MSSTTNYSSTRAEATASVYLIAPLSGYLVPIETVPDPVFAERMVGDGIAIDPVSQTLIAPCDGEIIQLHNANHAVALKTREGLEILIHIGLDTVNLKGQGFTSRVKVGDRVHTRDPLIHFDADYIALNARSLLTQMVVTNSEQVVRFTPHSGYVIEGQDVVLELAIAAPQLDTVAPLGHAITSDAITVSNPTGLHARPAAILANLAKKFNATVYLQRDGDRVDARSVVGIMRLDISQGDTVQFVADGSDAETAVAELVKAMRSGLGEGTSTVTTTVVPAETTAPSRPRSDDPNLIRGVAASPGVVVGTTYRIRDQDIPVTETGADPNQERRKLEEAIAQAKRDIEALQVNVQGPNAAIFAVHLELLDDPEITHTALESIHQGKSAAFAWKQSYMAQAEQLATLKNELLAARANDLRDVGGRVLRLLTGTTVTATPYPDRCILIAEDLTPSDVANLGQSNVLGVCTVGGSATSHVGILARSLDIPAIAGIEPSALNLPDGTSVILNGNNGTLRLHPSDEEVDWVQQRQARLDTQRQAHLAAASQPAITTDGQRIEVVANIGNIAEAAKVIEFGGEGVGLLRSEFAFMDRNTPPNEDEQMELYEQIAQRLGAERSLIIRTLDVGGDKPLPYLPIAREANPFLGERGIRLGFDRPELLRTQLRAILRASRLGNVQVMFPMIARLEEWRMAKTMLEEEQQTLGVTPIAAGIMVETPAAALMAEQFAQEVDFISIGTNDLTQYTLAMDRGHPKLAPYVDELNPAVLSLIRMAAIAMQRHGKWVGVCGRIASDPQAVPLLIGLGVTELSVSIPAIPAIKAQIRNLSLSECQTLAERAIASFTAAEVRALCPQLEE